MKAVVYIWPLLSKPAQQYQEARLIAAGYTGKVKTTVRGFTVYRVT